MRPMHGRSAGESSESAVKKIDNIRKNDKFIKYKSAKRFDNNFGNRINSKERDYICFCCGKVNSHHVANCKMRNVSCNSCGIKGHVEKVCLKNKDQKTVIRDILRRFNEKKSPSERNFLQNNTDSESIESNGDEEYGLDVNKIMSSTIIRNNITNECFKIQAEPMMVIVDILDMKMEIEIDTRFLTDT